MTIFLKDWRAFRFRLAETGGTLKPRTVCGLRKVDEKVVGSKGHSVSNIPHLFIKPFYLKNFPIFSWK